ncbi:hypothetical protein [Sorangium sp. So ce1151]|uniref:hypothetical protein n=1 Tax=Sorangium sp. So ce1151 TaxID=3133332 RepID=UPI003F615EE2
MLTALLSIGDASARPPAPQLFCESYANDLLCAASGVSCTLCHTRTESPVAWNAYGDDVRSAFSKPSTSDETFAAALPSALAAVEDRDSDKDGASNRDEIAAGTLPGDAASAPEGEATCGPAQVPMTYDVCRYDGRYALRKVMLEACGRSPTPAELAAMADTPLELQPDAVADALTTCMQSEFWRGREGVVWNIAHAKIRPTIFANEREENTDGHYDASEKIFDYFNDYALFVYTQIDGHDSRDLLKARYYVQRLIVSGRSVYKPVDELPGRQSMPTERRAGMLTTRWYLLFNNMFTALPRTAAAQAYRAYLNRDIALGEGLHPVPGEPVDYDYKGVAAPTCAGCHSTLDPLSYSFSRYDGVTGTNIDDFGRYLPTRLEDFYDPLLPGVSAMPEAGVLLGKPVSSLTEWAEVATSSQEFAASRVSDYWEVFFHAEPSGAELATFDALVQAFRTEHDFAIDPMLRDLVRTEAFGVP